MGGFTLMELLISMTILSIMSVLTIVSFSGAKAGREVNGAARELAATIREAQNYAVTGKNITATTTNRPCQFRLTATSGTGNFSVQQTNAGACDTVAGSSAYVLQNGVQFAANAQVRFDVPRGEPKDSAGAELTSGSITFTVAKNGLTAYVCVYPLGRIEEKGVGGGAC